MKAGFVHLGGRHGAQAAHDFRAHRDATQQVGARQLVALSDPAVDMVAFERDKIKGAVRTDFILSAEIIAITLGAVAAAATAAAAATGSPG